MKLLDNPNETLVGKLEWPEEAYLNEREEFYSELLALFGTALWIAVIPIPTPMIAARNRIESDCENLLQALSMPYDGVAWLCKTEQILRALSGLFHARQPHLVFLAFDRMPTLEDISSALDSTDGTPASSLLAFDDGELVELKQNQHSIE